MTVSGADGDLLVHGWRRPHCKDSLSIRNRRCYGAHDRHLWSVLSLPDGDNGWYTSDVSLTWNRKRSRVAELITEDGLCRSGHHRGQSCDHVLPAQHRVQAARRDRSTSRSSVTQRTRRSAVPPRLRRTVTAGTTPTSPCRSHATTTCPASPLVLQVETLSAEGAGQSASGTATDEAGNSASTTVSGINIDKTDPTISGSASPAPNGNGWNNSDVTVTFSGRRRPVGHRLVRCTDRPLGEGAGQSASGTAPTRLATRAQRPRQRNQHRQDGTHGRVERRTSQRSARTTSAPCPLRRHAVLSTPCPASTRAVVSGYATTVGSHTMTATAKDKAGNTQASNARTPCWAGRSPASFSRST